MGSGEAKEDCKKEDETKDDCIKRLEKEKHKLEVRLHFEQQKVKAMKREWTTGADENKRALDIETLDEVEIDNKSKMDRTVAIPRIEVEKIPVPNNPPASYWMMVMLRL